MLNLNPTCLSWKRSLKVPEYSLTPLCLTAAPHDETRPAHRHLLLRYRRRPARPGGGRRRRRRPEEKVRIAFQRPALPSATTGINTHQIWRKDHLEKF